jgi:chromatin segregation and condensation protein Rec8/ScpA/Scc1 (kleisin family)
MSQLKVRLVQMARDLEERTKWETFRLQEFLNMKEKEVEDRRVLCFVACLFVWKQGLWPCLALSFCILLLRRTGSVLFFRL